MSNQIIQSPYVLGNPKGGVPFKLEKWASPLLSITANSDNTQTVVGLTGSPDLITIELHCMSADAGYTAGEVIYASLLNWEENGTTVDFGFDVYLGTDNETLHYNVGDSFRVKNTGTFNYSNAVLANWKIKLKVFRWVQGDNILPIRTVDVVRLETKVVNSGDADVQFDLQQYFNEYEDFRLEFKDYRSATDGAYLLYRDSGDGSTFDSGVSDYQYNHYRNVAGTSANNDGTSTTIFITGAQGTGTANDYEVSSGILDVFDATNPNTYTRVNYQTGGQNNSPARWSVTGQGGRATNRQTIAVQFSASSGNMERGTFILYGKRKAP